MGAASSASDVREIRPQAGPQEQFLSSPADIAIIGGAAGGGKTFGLLLEPIRHLDNPFFGAVAFRRTYPQISMQGGLWDEASELYPFLGGKPNENDLTYYFPKGMSVQFAHMQHLKDRLAWKGAQIPLILFDQLEDFEEQQFWYMLSRNRSPRAKVAPYIRATCNPVPEDDEVGGWLHRLIQWWLDPNTGYAIPDRGGVVRWFVRLNEALHWGDSADELRWRFHDQDVRPKSLTFIPATLEDNPILEMADPTYRASLMAQPLVDRERLLKGNWNIKPSAGLVFNRAWFPFVDVVPKADVTKVVRYWDKAGTQGGGKFSAGVRILECGKRIIIDDVHRGQWSALNREREIQATAYADFNAYGDKVQIWVEQEPGSGGKESAENTIQNLRGFDVHAERVTGDKLTRAKPLAAQAEGKNVYLLTAGWNEAFLSELHRFDGESGVMDQVDAASGGFNKLTLNAPVAVVATVKPRDTAWQERYFKR